MRLDSSFKQKIPKETIIVYLSLGTSINFCCCVMTNELSVFQGCGFSIAVSPKPEAQ